MLISNLYALFYCFVLFFETIYNPFCGTNTE